MDCLVLPLQEKLEDWKKTVLTLDKEHAKGKNTKTFSVKSFRYTSNQIEIIKWRIQNVTMKIKFF